MREWGSRTLMRHFVPTGAVAALALGMLELASSASLITPSSGSLRLTSRQVRTGRTTVNIAAVTATADHHLTMTSGTVEKAYGIFHRLLRPMSTGLEGPGERY
jgi:hypothetical protein